MAERLLLLGVPIDNTTLAEAAKTIDKLIHESRRNDVPFYVSTVNSDFLANALGWNPPHLRDSELTGVLRRAALSTADGMPLVWLSRWLGQPLQGRVTGIDLLWHICAHLNANKMSVYLLGGTEKIGTLAAEKIAKHFPNLRIAGMNFLHIDVSGDALGESLERDILLVESINASAPDLLLINLGNPKQELWFERVRHLLKVPVSMGIGGSFSFVAGTIKRASPWMQKWGLEWGYRLWQEPRRLFFRYSIDIIKFFYMAVPLVIFHRLSGWIYRLWHARRPAAAEHDKLFISPRRTVATITVPPLLDSASVDSLRRRIADAFDHDDLIIDFRQLKHADLEGLNLLCETWLEAIDKKKEIYGLGMNGDMRLLLKLHRIWDLFHSYLYPDTDAIVSRFLTVCEHSLLYEAVYQENGYTVLSFFGHLDSQQDYEFFFAKLFHLKDCVIDLDYCNSIDNLGIAFLMKVRKLLAQEGRQLRLAGLSKDLHDQFKLAEVWDVFDIYPTVNQAINDKS